MLYKVFTQCNYAACNDFVFFVLFIFFPYKFHGMYFMSTSRVSR